MNTLTLSVDPTNSGTPEPRPFDLVEIDKDKTTYQGAFHMGDIRELLQLYRTAAKRSGTSRGQEKCSVKFTKDVSVLNADGSGNIILPLIGQVSFSVPLGTTDLAMQECRQHIVSFLDDDTAAGSLMTDLNVLISD
jgi:hypothetical protein